MSDDVPLDRWPILPGLKWCTSLEARTWLIGQRRAKGWSYKDVAKAFWDCATESDLYIGPGGGALFDRPTEKRAARFEREGEHIPDWVYWMPLAIQYAQVPSEDRWNWAREHIPKHSGLRREEEESEEFAKTYYLEEDEIVLIERCRQMSADERAVLHFFAQPKILRWWIASLKRAGARGTNLMKVIDDALL